MPIPQFSKTNKQSWRQKKRFAFANKPKNEPSLSSRINYRKKHASFLKNLFYNKNFIKFSGGAFLLLIFFVIILIAWISKDLPAPNKLIERQVAQSTKIYDRTGETILYDIHGDEKRTLINIQEIPDYVKWATISVEDKDFYKHHGFSLWAIFRTAITNVFLGKKAGGSTLTQQFIKNAVLSPEKTYTRKIKELILARKLENKFSKDEILQMYLNEIPYGSTAYGIEAASQRYFGKSVKEVNLAEAAVLAALPQAPSRYSPYGPNRELLINRQHLILNLMVEQGYTTEAKAEAAKLYKIEFKTPTDNILAPHFVMYVKEYLSEKYGEKMIEQEGLKIYTTLDLNKQKFAEEAITEGTVKNDKYNASNAALISIDPKTGQILAMVGSKNYFDENIDGQVNIATSKRQPGSSIKPLVYATAFEKGYTPNTVLFDVVTNFSNDPANPYEPHNYDLAEHGPVTMRKALAGSLNVPAVKTLYLAGIDNVIKNGQELGYSTFNDKNRFGLSLVLGGAEVKLIEHANAFSAFAREGVVNDLASILKIEDKNGNVIEEFKQKEKRVLEPKTARMINSVLSDNSARSFVFGEKNWLTLGDRPVAAKTGTTNDYKDAWTIGYTPSIIAGVWVGNNDNVEMKRGADGSVVAAPIWNNYMKKVLEGTPVEQFKVEAEVKTGKPVLDGDIEAGTVVKIDKTSGLLATENTPPSQIIEKTFKQAHCILYYVDKNNPLGDAPTNPSSDPQFNLWESRVLAWAEKNAYSSSTPPTEVDNLHKEENKPTFNIITPVSNQIISVPLLVSRIEGTAPRGINRAEYYINNNLLFTNSSYPFDLEKQITFLSNGFHNLKVRVCDDIDNCSEKSIEFNLILQNNNITEKETKTIWLSPGNGQAINSIDFPLSLSLKTSTPSQTAKIILFIKNTETNSIVQTTTLQPIEADQISTQWQNLPAPGPYSLFTETYSWNGKKTTDEGINVTISKPQN